MPIPMHGLDPDEEAFKEFKMDAEKQELTLANLQARRESLAVELGIVQQQIAAAEEERDLLEAWTSILEQGQRQAA
jgi:hypothetical protein